jgi:hypothetical protein
MGSIVGKIEVRVGEFTARPYLDASAGKAAAYALAAVPRNGSERMYVPEGKGMQIGEGKVVDANR